MNEDKNIGITDEDLETVQGWTPGDWRVKESKVPGYERNVDVVAGDLLICEVTGGGVSNPVVLAQVRANARLIAAAPALYAALENLYGDLYLLGMKEITLDQIYSGSFKDALAALMLARNESAKRPTSDLGNNGQAS